MRGLKLILSFLLLFSIQAYCQSGTGTVKYYLEIPDPINIPSVVINKGKTSLVFSNNTLTNVFKNYEIISFELAFPGGLSPILKIVYIIDCDPKLIETITRDYSVFFGRHEEVPPIQLLYIPNDFGGTTGDPNMAQPELTFIRAPEAWEISKGDGVKIGNSEAVFNTHEELVGKSTNLSISTTYSHGTQVAVAAAGNTNNNLGIASIGFNSHIITSAGGYSALIPIANQGARTINMSWGSCGQLSPTLYQYYQGILDQLWDSGVFMIAAAGNGGFSCPSAGPSAYHYPAAFNHVFAVTSVGHKANADSMTDGNRKDIFENFNVGSNAFGIYVTTYNDKVDLSAPGYDILLPADNNHTLINGYARNQGTSFSSPIVMGTVGLMFGANPCLFPDEIESILKLTAFKNDLLPLNLPYQGKIGAGHVDAYLAVDMAKDMALPTGTVEVKDRIIDRWDFNLRTAPYQIKMTNNVVLNNATVSFTAKNNIEIISGDYYPTSTGFVDLKINPVNTICNTAIQPSAKVGNAIKTNSKSIINVKLFPNPNKGIFTIILNDMNSKDISVDIFDIVGKLVHSSKANEPQFDINVSNLPSGMYFAKIASTTYNETLKFIKE